MGRFQTDSGFVIDTKTGQTYHLTMNEIREYAPPPLK